MNIFHKARDLYKLRSAGHWLQLTTTLSGQAELSSPSEPISVAGVSTEPLDLYLTTVESWLQTDQVFCEVMTAALYRDLFVTHNLICVLYLSLMNSLDLFDGMLCRNKQYRTLNI